MIILVLFEIAFNYFIMRKIQLEPYQKLANHICSYGLPLVSLLLRFLNPGIIDKNNYIGSKINKKYEDLKKYKICKICDKKDGIYIPRNLKSAHCNYCGVCIEEHHHHDLIFGICVGKNNTYLLFSVFFPILIIYLIRTLYFTCFTFLELYEYYKE